MKSVWRMALVLSAVSLTTSVAWSAFPHLMNFQGRLDDPTGRPVRDSSYAVTFRIFDQPQAGTALWEETQTVATSGGVFSVLLGAVDSIPDFVFYRDSAYFEIQPQGSDPILPRTRLTVVPYSLRAKNADMVGGQSAFALENLVAGVDAKLTTHEANPSAHHTKTVDASELIIGTLSPARLPKHAVDSTNIADQSIGADKLADEPGLSYGFKQLANLSSVMTIIDSAVITVPKSGWVLIMATGWFYKYHTTGTGDTYATVSLSGSRITHEDNQSAKFTILSSEPTGHHTDNFAISRVLPVGPGTTKVFLLGDMTGTGTPRVEKVHITTMYFPTAYGNIDISAQ